MTRPTCLDDPLSCFVPTISTTELYYSQYLWLALLFKWTFCNILFIYINGRFQRSWLFWGVSLDWNTSLESECKICIFILNYHLYGKIECNNKSTVGKCMFVIICFPFCLLIVLGSNVYLVSTRGYSAVVARSLCMWKAPGSIPGISKYLFLFCSYFVY